MSKAWCRYLDVETVMSFPRCPCLSCRSLGVKAQEYVYLMSKPWCRFQDVATWDVISRMSKPVLSFPGCRSLREMEYGCISVDSDGSGAIAFAFEHVSPDRVCSQLCAACQSGAWDVETLTNMPTGIILSIKTEFINHLCKDIENNLLFPLIYCLYLTSCFALHAHKFEHVMMNSIGSWKVSVMIVWTMTCQDDDRFWIDHQEESQSRWSHWPVGVTFQMESLTSWSHIPVGVTDQL